MCVNPPAVKTFPMQECEQLQRSFCLTRGWGKSHVLLELLEEFHKLKAVTSKQHTSATNPSEKILSKRWLSILSCGYLKSTLQSLHPENKTLSLLHSSKKCVFREGLKVSTVQLSLYPTSPSPSVPHTFLKQKPSQLSLYLYIFSNMAFKTSRFAVFSPHASL